MKNADKFKSVFGLYATEVWSMPEGEFLRWLNTEGTESEQRWILISERLPEEYEYVLLCDREPGPDEGTSYSRMAVGWLEDGQIHCWDDRAVREEFVAWMPLPEPYKEGEQE